MKDLSNYIPDEIKFNLPKAADRFPKVLFEGADSEIGDDSDETLEEE